MFESFTAKLNRRADGKFTRWERFTGIANVGNTLSASDRRYLGRLERRVDNNPTSFDTVRDVIYTVCSIGYEVKSPDLSARFYERQSRGEDHDFLDAVYLAYARYIPSAIAFIPELISSFYNAIYNRISTAYLLGDFRELYK